MRKAPDWTPDADELDRFERIAEAATPGPWHWSGYAKGHGPGPYIATWIPGAGRCTVMDTERVGMQGAQPRFRSPDGFAVAPARSFAVPEVDYRHDIADIDQPDARHMVTFDPETVLGLIRRIRQLESESGRR